MRFGASIKQTNVLGLGDNVKNNMKMSTNPSGVTPLGLIVAALIICVLASLAVPRLREASRGEETSGPPRVLATFEPAVSAAAGVVGSGVVVTCGSCVPEAGTSRR